MEIDQRSLDRAVKRLSLARAQDYDSITLTRLVLRAAGVEVEGDPLVAARDFRAAIHNLDAELLNPWSVHELVDLYFPRKPTDSG
jgi:hypothetical protein